MIYYFSILYGFKWLPYKYLLAICVYTILCHLILRLHWTEHRGKLYGLHKKTRSDTPKCQYGIVVFLFVFLLITIRLTLL